MGGVFFKHKTYKMALTNVYSTRMVEGTAAEFAADTEVHAKNIFLYATDTNVLKKGNGVDVFSALTQINA